MMRMVAIVGKKGNWLCPVNEERKGDNYGATFFLGGGRDGKDQGMKTFEATDALKFLQTAESRKEEGRSDPIWHLTRPVSCLQMQKKCLGRNCTMKGN